MGVEDEREIDLINRAAGGEQAAWRLLVDSHIGAITGYAWHLLGEQAEAEDVAQETFLRLVGKLGVWRADGPSLRAWLFRVATNLCIDRHRSALIVSLDDALLRPEEVASAIVHEAEFDQRHRVQQALLTLPKRQRIALVLSHYHGFSGREVAEMMAISVEAVESLLARARRALGKQLAAIKDDLLDIPRQG